MGILDDDVARVREATDIVALIGDTVGLRRVGRRWVGLCPFHAEKSPSFSVNQELGFYHCFGCQAKGDAITFVRETEHLDFVGAVEKLAAKANITLRYDDASYSKERKKRERLHEAVSAAIDFYHQRILSADDAKAARGYLRSRGFDGDAVRRFQIGYSPDEFDALSKHLQVLKFERRDITEAGLAFVNRRNSLQDTFRGRLMFPIHDARGAAVGFGARILNGDGPKYKNTAETVIYHKSRLLYGLDRAKGDIVASGEVIVCEGYTDVMGFALAGAPQAVATCGTALTEEHVQLLKNFARRIILAFDADAAGQGATARFYQWEHEYELDVRVADLPIGKDPGDVYKEDPARLLAAITDAPRLMQFKVNRLLAGADVTSPEGRARVAEQAVPILAEHPNELVREQYVSQVAGTLGIDHGWFKNEIGRGGRPRPRPAAADAARPPARRPINERELEMLRVAVHNPELVADRLDPVMLQDPLAQTVLEALMVADTFHHALAALNGEAADVLQRLAVEEPALGNDPDTYVAELAANLVEAAAAPVLQDLVRNGDLRSMELKRSLDQLVTDRADGNWSAVRDDTDRLVAWLAGAVNEDV